LIAEDNIINQKLIKRTMEDLGLTITIASNGLEGFQKRKDGNFDLMFMDINMPFMDGVEATKEILEWEREFNQPHIPILALTANALKGDRERFLEAGLDEYTTKPLVREEIINLLNMFLSDFIVDIEKTEESKESTSTQNSTKKPKRQMKVSGALAGDDEPKPKRTMKVSGALAGDEEPNTKSQMKISGALVGDETPSNNTEEKTVVKKDADVLIVKKSAFETKLLVKIVSGFNYSYGTVSSKQNLEELIDTNNYKVIVFDSDYPELDVTSFVSSVRAKNKNTKLVMLNNPKIEVNQELASLVDEVIKEKINKDIAKTIFEKYI